MSVGERGGRLKRRLGLADAVGIGVAAMVGAGVFAVWGPAAGAAGTAVGVMVALGIAAVVAGCNAASTAQLAVAYPSAGGAYLYGRERLGAWWGFAAGWSFVVGKTASCAAMALTFAAYLLPSAWQKPAAALAVAALVTLNCLGVTRTARAARIIVVLVLAVLALVVAAAAFSGGPADAASALFGMVEPLASDAASVSAVAASTSEAVSAVGVVASEAGAVGSVASPDLGVGADGVGVAYGTVQAAALLFFAFAGYARVATLGEEVRDPRRTIPRAIGVALGIALLVYLAVAGAVLAAVPFDELVSTADPLRVVVQAAGWGWAVPVVAVGAALASLGALLALIAGVGRTAFAMARDGELPRVLARVHPRFAVPHRAEIAVGVVLIALVLTVDLRSAIGFSSFAVLLYYAVANAAAFTQPPADRRPAGRAIAILGLAGCLILVATLPPLSLTVGVGVLAVGVAGRAVLLARRTSRQS